MMTTIPCFTMLAIAPDANPGITSHKVGDEAELLRITGDPSDPVFGVSKGESVCVIDVDRAAKVAQVKVTTGSEVGKIGFVPFANLDAGTQRVATPATVEPRAKPDANNLFSRGAGDGK
jgi:hypothetical protein